LRAYEIRSSATAIDKQAAHVAVVIYMYEPEATIATRAPEVIDLAVFLRDEDLGHRAISDLSATCLRLLLTWQDNLHPPDALASLAGVAPMF
jgi:hypothetical protein